jgi:hypothetical protein
MSIYYKLYPKNLSFAEACKALVSQGLRPQPCANEHFYLSGDEVLAPQLEALANSFSIRTYDTEEIARTQHERELKSVMEEIKGTDAYIDMFSALAERYRAGEFDCIKLSEKMMTFCLEEFPDSAEAIRFHFDA